MRGAVSGHIDHYVRDRMPPIRDWPALTTESLGYPSRLNAAADLLLPWTGGDHAGRPCLIGLEQSWSYGRFGDAVARVARLLIERYGLVPGNRVLLRGPNSPMLAACWLGVLWAGGVAVPTMPLLRAAELSAVLGKVDAAVALCDGRFVEELETARIVSGRMLPVIAFGGAEEFESLLEEVAGGLPPARTAADDPAVIVFTSGTTGGPKAAVHAHRDLLAIADLSPRSILETTADDVFCGSPTLAFAYGIGGLLTFPLRIGASAVLLDRTTPDRLVAAIERSRATILFAVPTLYRSITAQLEAGLCRRESLSSLRLCVSAGEPLPAPTFEAWREATGLIILDSLGTTELLNAVIHARPDAVRAGATGKPVPGYEAMVVDDSFQPVPCGEVGRLAVRGPTGCRYLDDPRQTQYVENGWNITGDVYHIDEDGFFWYHARTDDLIVSGGYKISGLEIETVLLRHELVEECAVVATPDPLRGNVPKAFVVLKTGTEPSSALIRSLQDFVKGRIRLLRG